MYQVPGSDDKVDACCLRLAPLQCVHPDWPVPLLVSSVAQCMNIISMRRMYFLDTHEMPRPGTGTKQTRLGSVSGAAHLFALRRRRL